MTYFKQIIISLMTAGLLTVNAVHAIAEIQPLGEKTDAYSVREGEQKYLGKPLSDEMDERQLKLNPSHITIKGIIALSKEGVPAFEIIDKIQETKSKYRLLPDDVSYLEDVGVDRGVINHMLYEARLR